MNEKQFKGRISKGIGGLYKVRPISPEGTKTDDEGTVPCRARGVVRHDGITPLPGDTVLCMAGKQPVGTVTEVLSEGDRTVITLQAEGFPIEGGFHTNVYDILPGFEDDFYTEIVAEDGSSTKTASWYGIVTGIF